MHKCRFSERLIELRNTAGLTQAELANVISVSDKVISKWENGLSTPDFETLILIAEHFGVSTDVMLGIEKDNAGDMTARLCDEFKDMDKNQAILTAFDISKNLVPAMFDSMDKSTPVSDREAFDEKTELGRFDINSASFRNCISNQDFYNLTVCSEDVRMAVMLWRNESDFQWLNDGEKKQQLAELFSFLADTDALSICYYIHSVECSWDFTAKYIAEHTGVSEEKSKQILDASVDLGLCAKQKAHLLSGEADIYNSVGEGNILALITLAYEHRYQWFSKSYDYNRNNGCKMIRGNGGDGNESV